MALEKLTDCNCLHKLDKDMISESLRVNLHIINDLLRGHIAKFDPDMTLVKRLKSQKIFIDDLRAKVDNTPICKS